jgi:hypothetical protein
MAAPNAIIPTPMPMLAWIVRLKMSGPASGGGSPAALARTVSTASRPDS